MSRYDCWHKGRLPDAFGGFSPTYASSPEEAAISYAHHVNADPDFYGVVSPNEGDTIEVSVRDGFGETLRFEVETVARYKATELATTGPGPRSEVGP